MDRKIELNGAIIACKRDKELHRKLSTTLNQHVFVNGDVNASTAHKWHTRSPSNPGKHSSTCHTSYSA